MHCVDEECVCHKREDHRTAGLMGCEQHYGRPEQEGKVVVGTDAQKAAAQEVAIGQRWTGRRPQVRQRQYKARNYVKDHDSQMAGVEDTHEHQAKGAAVGRQRDNRPEVKEKDPSHCSYPQHLERREPLERTLLRRCLLVHAFTRTPPGSRHGKRLVAQLVCIGNSNAILPMTTAGSRSSQIAPTCLLADARRFRVTVAFLSVDYVMCVCLTSLGGVEPGPPNVLQEQTRMHYVPPRVES